MNIICFMEKPLKVQLSGAFLLDSNNWDAIISFYWFNFAQIVKIELISNQNSQPLEGNHSKPERFNLKSIFQAILDNFNVNKGFIKTYRLLTTQPGQSIRTFLLGDRKLLTKPFQLLIVSTAIAAFLTINVMPKNEFVRGFEAGVSQTGDIMDTPEEEKVKKMEKAKEFNEKFMDSFSRYFNLVILLFIPFIGLSTYWFFKKKKYNYAEHVVFNSYILSYQNLIFIFLVPLIFFVSTNFNWIYLLTAYIYYFYACQRFFEMKFWPSFGRAFGALVVGTLMYAFVFSIVLIGIVIFLVKN